MFQLQVRCWLAVAAGSGLMILGGCAASPTGPDSASSPTAGATVSNSGAGDGNTPVQLSSAGWNCQDVPEHGVHCFPGPKAFGSSVNIPVKVFDTSDPTSDSAAFLGTENLVRADRYHGQPCLPGHGEYFLLPFGYYACHHY